MAPVSRPIDRFSLRAEGGEHMVSMVFDDIIVDTAALRPAPGARLNVNVRHSFLSLGSFVGEVVVKRLALINMSNLTAQARRRAIQFFDIL
jgi:hypothetical protein